MEKINELIDNGEYEKALRLLQKEIDKDPTDPLPYKLIGDCYHQLKKFQRMVNYWTKAKRLGYRNDSLDTALMTHSLKLRAEKKPDEPDLDNASVGRQP